MKKPFRIGAGVFAVLLLGLLWYFSSQTGEESGKLSTAIARFIIRFLGLEESRITLSKVGHIVRKTAHFGLFALIGLSFGFALAPADKPARAYWALPIVILYAVADELHQHFVAGRAAMWQDSLLDSCGAFTGITIVFVLLKVCRHTERKAD